MERNSRCEICAHLIYDEEEEQYVCAVNLDEDEMARLFSHYQYECLYFRLYDEYRIVRKQM